MNQQNFADMDTSFGSDLDSYLDLDNTSLFQHSPAVSQSPFNTSTSSSPSMSQTTPSPEFSAPSHPYDLHPQQIGVGLSDSIFSSDMPLMQLDNNSNSQIPAFFFPEDSPAPGGDAMDHGISPMMTTADEVEAPAPRPAPSNRKIYYSGIHQEMFNAQRQKMAQQQKSGIPTTAEEKINAIFNNMRAFPAQPQNKSNANGLLPHIARMKKEEDEMDEDERLLASEEGKKLSSKERRQLRNKVSARAFRSRRKEYITQLETEVAKKNAEAQKLQDENDRLKTENQRLEGLSRMLLKSPAFSSFLEDMSNKGLQIPLGPTTQVSAPAPAPAVAAPEPRFNPARDRNPNAPASDDWALAYQRNQVYQVFRVELPEPPALEDLLEDDFMVADGFFPTIRDEKANFTLPAFTEEEAYQPPENIMGAYQEVAAVSEKKKETLDDLFPGVGVADFLERLEKVVGGEAQPQDMFELQQQPTVQQQPADQTRHGANTVRPSICRSNQMLSEAEKVYHRVGRVTQ